MKSTKEEEEEKKTTRRKKERKRYCGNEIKRLRLLIQRGKTCTIYKPPLAKATHPRAPGWPASSGFGGKRNRGGRCGEKVGLNYENNIYGASQVEIKMPQSPD